VKEISSFQVPAKQAMHLADALEHYSSGRPSYRLGRWWQLKDDQLPSKAVIVAYLTELESRIAAQLMELTDADLGSPYTLNDEFAKTVLGLHVYALRHTMHHHGQLATLAVYHTQDGGSWE
jgi:hypothetical protein